MTLHRRTKENLRKDDGTVAENQLSRQDPEGITSLLSLQAGLKLMARGLLTRNSPGGDCPGCWHTRMDAVQRRLVCGQVFRFELVPVHDSAVDERLYPVVDAQRGGGGPDGVSGHPA